MTCMPNRSLALCFSHYLICSQQLYQQAEALKLVLPSDKNLKMKYESNAPAPN